MDPFIQSLIFLAVVFWFMHFLLNTKFEGYLERITHGMEGAYHHDRKLWSRLHVKRVYSFQTQLHRRDVWIRYSYFPLPSKRLRNDELEIAFPVVQKFWLRIVRRSAESNFQIHTDQEEAAHSFMDNSYVSDQFRMFRGLFQKLEIYRGQLRIFYTNPAAIDFGRSDLDAALAALHNLALFYEAQSIPLRIVVAAAHEVCPYCRETLNPALDDVVRCAQCSTHIHQVCWKENAHCTTWGCSATVPVSLSP